MGGERPYTSRGKKVIQHAMAAARELGDRHVGTEHLFLGLLREEEGVAARALRAVGVTWEGARIRVREMRDSQIDPTSRRSSRGRRSKRRKKGIGGGNYNFTDRVRKVLARAREEAVRLGHDYVGTEHLLLGLLLEEKGIAAQVLVASGVTVEKARGRLREVLGEPGGEEGREAAEVSAAARESVWFLEIDPDADAPMYEQIIARIEEAVAIGRLEEGERLPPIRQLAEELGIAPGTVARAYSALEERRVLVTEGAKGTRVAPRTSSAEADDERAETLEGLLRPVVVAAYHLGASAEQIRKALDRAMKGIFGLLA